MPEGIACISSLLLITSVIDCQSLLPTGTMTGLTACRSGPMVIYLKSLPVLHWRKGACQDADLLKTVKLTHLNSSSQHSTFAAAASSTSRAKPYVHMWYSGMHSCVSTGPSACLRVASSENAMTSASWSRSGWGGRFLDCVHLLHTARYVIKHFITEVLLL